MIPRSAIRWAAIASMCAIIVASFGFIGSPSHNRAIMQDKKVVATLEDLNCAINEYHFENGKMPESLDQLNKNPHSPSFSGAKSQGCTPCGYIDKLDGTEAGFKYTATAQAYHICATFNTDWDEVKRNQYEYQYRNSNNFTDFKAGEFCFDNKVTCTKQGDKK